ncbi:helix-turn-helix transcriptional regulator [Haloferax sp. DFSO52]|uniref:helix-turn-helix transcriptional regulator n=1 Tax=Haloferax sp. DFSO52 TaxID=3388505 RepID=UPI003A87E51D
MLVRWTVAAVTSPLDAALFLARSENRVRALNALTERPYDRADLAETLGISRVTAQRTLDIFITYRWATVENRCYRATELGEVVFAEFESMLETLETTQRLAVVTPWLPREFDVDVRRLTTARITLPASGDPTAPLRRATELMGNATAIRGVGSGIASDVLRTNHRAVVEDGQSFEVVFSGGVLDVIAADKQMSRWLSELLEAGGTIYRHETPDLLLGEFDRDVIFMGVADESGTPQGAIESSDPAVREWFETTFERYRTEATPVDAESFTP